MNSAADIWSKVLSLMEADMTATTIHTWFDDTVALSLDEDKFILHTPSDFKRDIILSRYLPPIQKALHELFSADFQVVVLGAEELEKYQNSRRPKEDGFLPGTEEYTFERFVVGSSNKFAHAAARAVADHPALNYNPLFIYGESGLGKTHLLYAIAHKIHADHPDYRIVYIKGDAFTNELIQAIREGRNQEFREKFRSADVFLMDDVQFIAGKDSTMEEMFHTFNTLYETRKQIVFTADRPPKEMLKLEDRLKTRFEWGLIADIQPPDYETRMAIIKNKSIRMGNVNLKDSFCIIKDGQMMVHGLHVSPYEKGNIFNRDPVRSRRLLMHKREIRKLHALVKQDGYALVPLSVYFKDSRVKLEIGLCRGKKNYDKRAAASQRDAKREIDRTLKERNR